MAKHGKLKIWGRKTSINVMKVLWACEELGLPYDRVDVGGSFGGTQEAGYLAMNPNARVPTIQDGDFTLWESNVCVRYLCHTYGNPGLWPEDEPTRWLAEQWMDWQQTALNPELSPLFWQLIRTPPEQQDKARIESARQATAKQVAILDAHLARRAFVAGPDFTMADLPVGCSVYRWLNFKGIERPKVPHVEQWYQRLTQREGYKKHIMNPMV